MSGGRAVRHIARLIQEASKRKNIAALTIQTGDIRLALKRSAEAG